VAVAGIDREIYGWCKAQGPANLGIWWLLSSPPADAAEAESCGICPSGCTSWSTQRHAV